MDEDGRKALERLQEKYRPQQAAETPPPLAEPPDAPARKPIDVFRDWLVENRKKWGVSFARYPDGMIGLMFSPGVEETRGERWEKLMEGWRLFEAAEQEIRESLFERRRE